MDKTKLSLIGISVLALASIVFNLIQYNTNKQQMLGAVSQYGMIGYYSTSTDSLSNGLGAGLAIDVNRRLILSPSTTISIIGE
jgi:hypothetical protein